MSSEFGGFLVFMCVCVFVAWPLVVRGVRSFGEGGKRVIRSWYVAIVFGFSVVLVVVLAGRAAVARGCAPECFFGF